MRTDTKLCCLKTALTISLCTLWLVGTAIFGALLWLFLTFWTNEYLGLNTKLDHYLILIYVSLVTGAIITGFSILGLFGGCLKIKWLLAVYLMVLVLSLLLTISATVYGTLYRTELQTSLMSEDLLHTIIKSSYSSDHTHRISQVLDFMQKQLECCGSKEPSDYDKSIWSMKMLRHLPNDTDHADTVPVPASCCKEFHSYQNHTQMCYVYEQSKDKIKSSDIWQSGCEEKLQQFLEKYWIVLIVIVAVFFFLQVICVIVCSVYINLLNSLYVPQPDDVVYDMAHNQEKSPYPSRGDYREYYN